MNLSKIIEIDLTRRSTPVQLGETAVAGDSGSRSLTFRLLENGAAWAVPDGVRAAVAFRTAEGLSGEYDLLPDGTDAFAIAGNCITVRLVDQITAKAGVVRLMLVLRDRAMRQLSTFPILMTVVGGIEDAERLPEQYYRVRDLDQLNAELERILALLASVDTEANIRACAEARAAAEEAKQAALSVNAEELTRAIAGKGDDVYVEDGRLYLLSGEQVIGEGIALPEMGGLVFDSGYVDEAFKLHLTLNGVDIEGFTPFEIPVGGGGAASVMALTTLLESLSFSILERDTECVIPFSWTSVDSGVSTGSGFAEWTVNGSRVALVAVEQGENAFDVRKYLTAGSQNTVVLKVTDVYGVSRTLTFTVTVTSYSLSWNLAETGLYGPMGVAVRLTPVGSGEKIVKVSVDDEVISEQTVTTTGRTISVTVPVQGHGAHTVKAWMEVSTDGEPLITEPLVHVGVWLATGVTTPVVALLTPEVSVGQYGTAAIRYFVVDPASETTTVSLKAGDADATVLEGVDRSVRTWYYKATSVGEVDMVISCGTVSATAKLTVTSLGYDIAPVTAGLELDLDPAGRSNEQTDRASFGYLDADGVNHPLEFSENFDWVNGGFQTDADGVTAFVVRRGTTVTLDRGLFDTDCRTTGRNIKLIFKSENVRNYDAQLMTCKSGNVGLVVNAQQATVTSQLETMTVPYYEGRKIEMDVCIEAENEHSMAWIDMKAIPSCPPVKYGSTDTWGQTSPAKLVIGSEDADVWLYRLKLYGNSLNRYEVLDNFIADCADPAEMVARYERNDVFNDDGTLSIQKVAKRNPMLRAIHIKAKRMTTGKEDEVVCDIEIIYEAGGEEHHLIILNAVIKAQGTSSLEYILAALNLDADLAADGCVVTNGLGEVITEYAMTENSIPVSYFNLKANVASSESANNVCLADDYNTFDPFVCAGKAADSRVRDTVEGHPCAVFFTNTSDAAIEVGARTVASGETILYFAGDMNNSKKNFAVFGQDNSKWPKQCCVEVMNNTELPCRFREDIGDDETFDGGNFEFRFPKAPTDEMKQAFTAMQRWVVSCTPDLATDVALDSPVTYDGVTYSGDTAEYRKAKFVAEFEAHFIKDQMLFHRLFTDENCMTDNNAKNLFFCYEYVEELEDYRWCVRCDYDNDTGLGNDNSGGLTFTYGLELHDMVGDSYVFNAHDSTLWSNMDELMADDLTALRISMVGSGAWDPDRRSKKFRDYQAITPEAVRIEDAWNKYFVPYINADAAAYPRKCYGTKEDQREQFLQFQHIYKSSQHIDLSNRSNAISMRATIDNAEAGNVTTTGYCDMYHTAMYGNGGTVKVKAKRNTPTLLQCPTDSLGDTETYLFPASHFTAISSLAALKPKFVLATTAQRLRELIVGSGETGYQNLNLNQLGVGNNTMLELLDLRGAPNLVTALDLSALTALEEFLANGSGITGVTFARNAPLRIARIPAVSSFVGLDLTSLETFVMDGTGLLSLRVENCPAIDTLALCKAAGGLERGRLTEVDWTDGDASAIMALTGLSGFNAQGKLTGKFVLTGRAHVAVATQLEIDAIAAAFPELELTVDTIVPSCTVTFQNHDGAVLHTQSVREGGYAANPIAAGYIDTPEKESDVEYHYAYIGWDKELGPITADTVITAVFSASDRYYRVTYWADDAESKVLQEKAIIAHGRSEYVGSDPEGEGVWMGWDADASDVVSDMDIHAVFIVPVLPDSVPETFDFLYSDDPNDVSAFTLAEFAGVLKYGAAKAWFQVGDRIKMVIAKNDVFTDTQIILQVLGFDHCRLAGGAAFAGVIFGMAGVMNAGRRMNATQINTGGWPSCEMRAFLNETVFPALPRQWQAMIQTVQVRSSAGDSLPDIVTSDDRLFLLSLAEVGFNADVVPYMDEVDPDAAQITFQCFTDHASRIRRQYNGTGTAMIWWLRSPYTGGANFAKILGSGYWNENYSSTDPLYVSWACCMGGEVQ